MKDKIVVGAKGATQEMMDSFKEYCSKERKIMAEILEQIGRLDRRELVALIREAAARLETLETEGEWELSPEDEAELQRRVAEANANPLEGDDWPTVRARIEAQTGLAREAETEKIAA